MPTVVSVRLRYVPKDYWFDPAGIEVLEGDHVLVETQRGQEMGLCVGTGIEIEEEDLHSPLKRVLRVATDDDFAQVDSMEDQTRESMMLFRELVEKMKLDMQPVAVEYMFDGTRATFYFTADERVDFRELVRELVSRLHVHVDMRQIGVRDEARAVGGYGHCGEELCCVRFGGEFKPVSIRMAKEQDLPLNPAKISGLCGRLMCCLRYEFEAYKDFKSRAPKRNALIDTPMGLGKVVEFDTPREIIKLRFEDGKSLQVPLSAMDTGDKVAREGERVRPCHISPEAFDQVIEELHHDKNLAMMGEKYFSSDPKLADKTADQGSSEGRARRRNENAGGSNRRDRGGESRSSRSGGSSSNDRHARKRKTVTIGNKSEDNGSGSRAQAERTPRNRNNSNNGQRHSADQAQLSDELRNQEPTQRRRRRRRGGNGNRQGGSGQGADQRASEQPRGEQNRGGEQRRGGENAAKENSGNRQRRNRNRAQGQNRNGSHQQGNQGGDRSRRQDKPRPGQHSSSVSGDAARRSNGGNDRKPRRRHRSSGEGKPASNSGASQE